jgi:hypothetical protein
VRPSFKVFLGLLLALGPFGCGVGTPTTTAGNPAIPPSPPAEIPASLTFPPTIGIDLTKVASPGSGALASELPALQVGDNVSDAIFTTTTGQSSRVVEVNRVMDDVFGTLHQITIPITRPVTKFTGYAPVTSQIPDEETGQFPTHLVRFDFNFEDFDENGDGSKDGFSGCTCPLRSVCSSGALCPKTIPTGTVLQPVGFRIWVTDTARDGAIPERFVSGFFTVLPTDTNRGAGLVKGVSLNTAVFDEPFSPSGEAFDYLEPIKAVYDQHNPENRTTDYKTREPAGKTGDFDGFHQEYAQIGPEDSSIRTVNLANSIDSTVILREIARWKEDQDLIGLSRDVPDSPADSFTGACAVISTGQVNDVDPSDGNPCRDLKDLPDIQSDPVFEAFRESGIGVSGDPFLDILGADELTEAATFSDFPPTPLTP